MAVWEACLPPETARAREAVCSRLVPWTVSAQPSPVGHVNTQSTWAGEF